MMQRLQGTTQNPNEQQGMKRLFLTLFTSRGVVLAPGDRVVLYEERWDLFPLGERQNHRRVESASFLATADDATR